MHASHTLLVFLTSAALAGCAHDEPGLKLMNERSEYQDEAPETSELNLGSSEALGNEGNPKPRPEPRVAMIWVHPQKISDREQFWGAWVSLRLEGENWESATNAELEPGRGPATPKDNALPVRKRKKK